MAEYDQQRVKLIHSILSEILDLVSNNPEEKSNPEVWQRVKQIVRGGSARLHENSANEVVDINQEVIDNARRILDLSIDMRDRMK